MQDVVEGERVGWKPYFQPVVRTQSQASNVVPSSRTALKVSVDKVQCLTRRSAASVFDAETLKTRSRAYGLNKISKAP